MTIEDLISEGEEIKKSIVENKLLKNDVFQIWKQKTIRFLNQTAPGDIAIESFEACVDHFNPVYCSQQSFDKLLAVLIAFKELPQNTKKTKATNSSKQNGKVTITNNLIQSQEQNQNQSLDYLIFEEAIKDELTGNQIKSLRKLLNDEALGDAEKKECLENKFKEFGPDVMSKVLTRIVEHPEVLPRI